MLDRVLPRHERGRHATMSIARNRSGRQGHVALALSRRRRLGHVATKDRGSRDTYDRVCVLHKSMSLLGLEAGVRAIHDRHLPQAS